MIKFKRIKFINHPILNNLDLDFCFPDGSCADTIIIAGENGTGKSTIIDSLYRVTTGTNKFEAIVDIDVDGVSSKLTFYYDNRPDIDTIFVKDNDGFSTVFGHAKFFRKYPLRGIYSDVDISFSSRQISSVTSLELDVNKQSRRSSDNISQEIKQLIIDIQDLDDQEVARKYREAKKTGLDINTLEVIERIPRFSDAFNYMFSGLLYSRIENTGSYKVILFQKYGVDISIDDLSSGEKQIVYRGCFLLRDINALDGSIVFIDEPEISMHPNWQKKIMGYYQSIFTSEKGNQTSQIFAVTHSPFIVHNSDARTKVIVLQRKDIGEIVVCDKPEYYSCDTTCVIQDAFDIDYFSSDTPTVYLEGRTDEKYFCKALDVFGYKRFPYKFKWVGYLDNDGQEVNTGKDSLDKARHFLIAKNLPIKTVCLYDCDTNKEMTNMNNVFTMAIPRYANSKGINLGIENALIFDDIDLKPYYQHKHTTSGYGEKKDNEVFKKMDCCDAICAMKKPILQNVLRNLKTIIDEIAKL